LDAEANEAVAGEREQEDKDVKGAMSKDGGTN